MASTMSQTSIGGISPPPSKETSPWTARSLRCSRLRPTTPWRRPGRCHRSLRMAGRRHRLLDSPAPARYRRPDDRGSNGTDQTRGTEAASRSRRMVIHAAPPPEREGYLHPGMPASPPRAGKAAGHMSWVITLRGGIRAVPLRTASTVRADRHQRGVVAPRRPGTDAQDVVAEGLELIGTVGGGTPELRQPIGDRLASALDQTIGVGEQR